MSNESPLADVLAFVDRVLEQSTDNAEALLSASGDEWDPYNAEALLSASGDEWDPTLLLQALDNDSGDFASGDSALTQTQRSTSPVQTQTQAPRQQLHGKVKKTNKNKARDERRFVLIQLRDEVEKLEFTLQQLHNMRNKQQPLEYTSFASKKRSGEPLVWQEICARQLQRRLTAERENSQLKQELEREKELAKCVQKLLYKRRMLKETGPEAEKHTRRTDISAGYVGRIAACIFGELAAGVESICHQVEGVDEALTSLPAGGRRFVTKWKGWMKHSLHSQQVEDGRDEHLFDRKVLAFSLHAIGDAWWKTWHDHRGRSVHESVGDTITETFGLEMNDFNANTSVSSYGQQILRRTVGAHRIKFIWNAYMEPFVFDNERVTGIYFLEQGHVCINRESANGSEFSTSLSTSYTITPVFVTPELHKNSKVTAVVDFFVSSLFSTMKMRSEMVENLLLDHVLENFNVV
ncbi:hypothetical protein PHMEG_00016154 [Phytophthora megakarya]|uniref:M96 mating-specific protein n=1 Tax=Phytophthora megakarya TaxID=4795 RepID=A0A225VZY8_9STRA|nr:hypothetical protein PHMEG_00016154 [Phytophthora megakarya]